MFSISSIDKTIPISASESVTSSLKTDFSSITPLKNRNNIALAFNFKKGKIRKRSGFNNFCKLRLKQNSVFISLMTSLYQAIDKGQMNRIRRLLLCKQQMPLNNNDFATAIAWTLDHQNEKNAFKVVELLIFYGADVKHYRADVNHYRVDVNYYSTPKSPLVHAIAKRYPSVVQLLIKNQVDVNQLVYGETPLSFAVRVGCKPIIRLLLASEGININETGRSLDTPLYIAVEANKKTIVTMLLQNKANMHLESDTGDTPLICAIKNYYEEIVEMLVKNGADVNQVDTENKTPLIHAIDSREEDYDFVKMLLENGAKDKINEVDDENKTPLRYAIDHNSYSFVEILLQYGANVNQADEEGKTPLMHVRENNRSHEIEELLFKSITQNNHEMS